MGIGLQSLSCSPDLIAGLISPDCTRLCVLKKPVEQLFILERVITSDMAEATQVCIGETSIAAVRRNGEALLVPFVNENMHRMPKKHAIHCIQFTAFDVFVKSTFQLQRSKPQWSRRRKLTHEQVANSLSLVSA